MDEAKEVAELINLESSYGYCDIAVQHAAIYALNSASVYKGRMRKRVIEDVLADLVLEKAVFDVSGAYRICLEALKAIDNAAKTGVDISVQDAICMATDNG